MNFARETWIVFTRAMRLGFREPVWLFIALSQPILYLALFGPLLEKVVESTPDLPPGDAWQVFVPGLLVQLGLFGTVFVGFGLVAEYRAGVIERMRVTPASRAALLLGRVLRDVVVLVVQATLLTLVSIPFGLRAPVGGVVVALLLVAALGAAFSALSYAAALVLKTEDALASVLNSLSIPVLLLSGILLPMTLAPAWLQTVSDINPLKHVVEGAREFFLGGYDTSPAWWGAGLTVLLVILGWAFGVRRFRRESS
jgi:ABC-2 type transport system permease protein